jgi:hypothetical protein
VRTPVRFIATQYAKSFELRKAIPSIHDALEAFVCTADINRLGERAASSS